MSKVAEVYLTVGSNMGDRVANVLEAVDRVGNMEGVELLKRGELYETEPQDVKDQQWFVNAAVMIRAELGPWELLRGVKEIESKMGRAEGERRGPRVIDIDIIFYGDVILYTPDLMIPHPRAVWRRFVLRSVADIDPGFVHPALGRTVLELLEDLPPEGQKMRKIKA